MLILSFSNFFHPFIIYHSIQKVNKKIANRLKISIMHILYTVLLIESINI